MPSLTPAMSNVLDNYFDMYFRQTGDRPPAIAITYVEIKLASEGLPTISPQHIGGYFANLLKRIKTGKRAIKVVPNQERYYRTVYDRTHHPFIGTHYALMFLTGQTFKQIKIWFENKNRAWLSPEDSRYGTNSSKVGREMLAQYNMNRASFMNDILTGALNLKTGERQKPTPKGWLDQDLGHPIPSHHLTPPMTRAQSNAARLARRQTPRAIQRQAIAAANAALRRAQRQAEAMATLADIQAQQQANTTATLTQLPLPAVPNHSIQPVQTVISGTNVAQANNSQGHIAATQQFATNQATQPYHSENDDDDDHDDVNYENEDHSQKDDSPMELPQLENNDGVPDVNDWDNQNLNHSMSIAQSESVDFKIDLQTGIDVQNFQEGYDASQESQFGAAHSEASQFLGKAEYAATESTSEFQPSAFSSGYTDNNTVGQNFDFMSFPSPASSMEQVHMGYGVVSDVGKNQSLDFTNDGNDDAGLGIHPELLSVSNFSNQQIQPGNDAMGFANESHAFDSNRDQSLWMENYLKSDDLAFVKGVEENMGGSADGMNSYQMQGFNAGLFGGFGSADGMNSYQMYDFGTGLAGDFGSADGMTTYQTQDFGAPLTHGFGNEKFGQEAVFQNGGSEYEQVHGDTIEVLPDVQKSTRTRQSSQATSGQAKANSVFGTDQVLRRSQRIRKL